MLQQLWLACLVSAVALFVTLYWIVARADRTLRALAFFDMGQVWGQSVFCPDGSTPVFSPTTPVVCPTTGTPIYRNQKVDLGDLRYSVGIGIAWISPLGPLRLAFAQPVRKFAGDKIQKLQFQIGTSF